MDREWVNTQADLCSRVAELNQRQSVEASPAGIGADEIIFALQQFQECVRYLNTRRSAGAILKLSSEADVQDAVFLMLRLWVPDLVSENPTDRQANRYTVSDFISPSTRCFIEIKYVRDASHGRHLAAEMHDDIEMYRHHHRCDTLVFFVYDPNSLIPDVAALRRQIEEPRIYSNRALRCVLIVK
jgi:hypothetical protein